MASVTIKGDFGGLANLRKLIEEAPDLLETISHQMAEETVGLVKDQFRAETDPYGAKWKRKKKRDGRKTLSGRTSRLKGGWHVTRTSKSGFGVAPSVDYATYHQSGTSRMAQRLLLPTRSRGLPRQWRKSYSDVSTDVLRAHFSKLKKTGGGSADGSGARLKFPTGLVRKALRLAMKAV